MYMYYQRSLPNHLCYAVYPTSPATLTLGEFHQSFLSEFAPVVEGYIDDLEATLVQDLNRSFAVETWMPVRYDVMMMS